MVVDLSIEIKNQVSDKEGRAKHLRMELNKKRIDFPRKATHISKNDSSEVSLFRKEFDDHLVSEFVLKITPKGLRELVGDASKHQSNKDAIRNMLSETGGKGINIAYPMLVNERSPNESEVDFRAFGKPSERVLEKLFDLLDVEGFDMIILPVSSSNGDSLDWVKMATKVFKERHADFLKEHMLSGFVPRNVMENTAITMAQYYLENGIESLTFDFDARKVPEGRMRGIIDKLGTQWRKIHVHGVNVPHFDWHGTWRKSVLPAYDLLVSIYGFDSFSNLRSGKGEEEIIPSDKIKDKMNKKRYQLIDTYGMYDSDGLKKISETHSISCNCPTCRKIKPLEIYEKPVSLNSLETLKTELKIHRLYSTHKEVNQFSPMIDKDKYTDHVKTKKDAANEVSSILKNLSKQKKLT
jgi:hypothetical protein